jgi:hypothetical protein
MLEPTRYVEYTPDTRCSVQGCEKQPEYEVYLYDYYPFDHEEFFEQDYTCPFLCEHHMEENESLADGLRTPRGRVRYPHTNRHQAQGYIKYSPIRELFDCIYEVDSTVLIPETRLEILSVNEELIKYLAKRPEMLYELDPRKFEELVAHIFQNQGFDVTLTPKTRDGGRDIQAVSKNSLGNMLYLIECKRYKSSNKVGVEFVRSLYGVKQSERATKGILVTTSSFTKDALNFASPLQYELSLRDYEGLKEWLNDYK